MKVKALISFYGTETGTVKKNATVEVSERLGEDLVRSGLVVAIPNDKPKAAKKTTGKQAKA